jgi:hypothetical protein
MWRKGANLAARKVAGRGHRRYSRQVARVLKKRIE